MTYREASLDRFLRTAAAMTQTSAQVAIAPDANPIQKVDERLIGRTPGGIATRFERC